MVISKFLTDTVTIYTRTTAVGIGGEKVYTYSSSFDVSGSFQNASGQWTISGGVEARRKTKTFYCTSTLITDYNRIVYQGKTFEVINVHYFPNGLTVCDLQNRSTS